MKSLKRLTAATRPARARGRTLEGLEDLRRADEDDEYVATTTAHPSLSWLAPTPEEALAGLRALVLAVQQDLSDE